MAILTTAQQKRLDKSNHQWRKLDIAARIQNLDTDGNFTGGTTGAGVRVTGGAGGITANFFVYISGYDTTEEQFVVLPADAATSAKAVDIFWCPTAITAAAVDGYAYKQGAITGVNTNAGNVGDPVYLADASAGGWTLTEPTGTDRVRQVGSIAVKSTTIGVISVDLGGEAITVHDHADNAGGGALTITGTTSTTFEIDSDGTIPAMALGVGTTGDFTTTLSPPVTLTADRAVRLQDAAGTVALTSAKQSLTCSGATSGGILISPTATGTNTLTLANQALSTAMTLTFPSYSSGSNYFAITTNSDGSVASTGATGTTNIAFETYTGTAEPSIAITGSSGGTGDYTQTISAAATVTVGDATFLLPNTASAGDTIVCTTIAATMANKILTAPTINAGTLTGTFTISGSPTISGTWANLGTVTTVDIDGGTADSVIIGGTTPAAGAFTTVSSSGAATLASIVCTAAATFGGGYGVTGATISTAGVGQFNGALTTDGVLTADSIVCTEGATVGGGYASSGTTITTAGVITSSGAATFDGNVTVGKDATAATVIIYPTTTNRGTFILSAGDGATDHDTTLASGAVNGGAAVITLPILTCTLPGIGLNNVFTGANTFASLTGNDASLGIAGTPGSTGAGGIVAVTGGAGDGAGNAGGAITGVTGAGVAHTSGTGGASGAWTVVSGAAGTATTGTGGASGLASLTTAAGGAATGATSTGGASGTLTIASGAGGAANDASACVGGVGGAIAITGGAGGASNNAASTGGDGASITVYAGSGGASSGGTAGDGGSLTLRAGAGDTAGTITIGATNAAAIAIGAAGNITTITGGLAMTLDDNIIMNSAGTNGYFEIDGSVSGGIKLLALATGTALTTITNQNVAAATITLPEATCTLPGLGLANTFSAANLFSGNIEQNATAGAASSVVRLVVRKDAMADGVATAVLTVTCPNVAHAAALKITALAMVADQESARCAQGMAIFSREAGSVVVGAVATLELEQIATGGTETLTLAYGLSAAVGAAGASNTMDLQFTLDTSAATDGEIIVVAELINGEGTGITVAAS